MMLLCWCLYSAFVPNVFIEFPNLWFKNTVTIMYHYVCHFSLETRLLTFTKFNTLIKRELQRKKQLILGKILFQPIFESGIWTSQWLNLHTGFRWFKSGPLFCQTHLNYWWRQATQRIPHTFCPLLPSLFAEFILCPQPKPCFAFVKKHK